MYVGLCVIFLETCFITYRLGLYSAVSEVEPAWTLIFYGPGRAWVIIFVKPGLELTFQPTGPCIIPRGATKGGPGGPGPLLGIFA